jgi:ribosomal protein S27AE
MTGESVEMGLMPCEDCGTLIVLHIERVNCGPCVLIAVTGEEEEI